MCKVMEEVLQEGIDLGINLGAEKTQKRIVEQMLQKKMPLNDIVDCTGMPLSDIMALREKMSECI